MTDNLPRPLIEQGLPSSSDCFVCGRNNELGLQLRFRRVGELEVVTRCVLRPEYNGFGGRSHGGVVAALLDEAMGWATVLTEGRFTFTVELNVRYREPVPLQEPLEVRGRVTRHSRRLTFAEAEVRTEGGRLLASGSGKFMAMPEDESGTVADALLYEDGDWRPSERQRQ